MAKLWTRRIERRVSGGCNLGANRGEWRQGEEEEKKGVGWRRALKERGRHFSKLANAARLLLTVAAWLNGETPRRSTLSRLLAFYCSRLTGLLLPSNSLDLFILS